MNEEQEEIYMTISEAEAKIAKMEKWQELLNNKLFKELVTDDYLGDDAVRLTIGIKPKAEDNEVTNNLLMAKAMFSRFVGKAINDGQTAVQAVEENQELLDKTGK